MRKKKISRYQQLTDAQIGQIKAPNGGLALSGELSSFTGPRDNAKFFDRALQDFRLVVANWKTADAWVHAFVKRCNSKDLASKRSYETICSQFKNGFAKFVVEDNLTQEPLSALNTQVVDRFHSWLHSDLSKKTGVSVGVGSPRSKTTSRRYYQQLQLLVEILQSDSRYSSLVDGVTFKNVSFTGSASDSKPTEVIDDEAYLVLYKGCRQLALATVEKVRYAQALFKEPVNTSQAFQKPRGYYSEINNVLIELNRLYPKQLPSIEELRVVDSRLADRILRKHNGYRAVQEYFYPSSATILPFIILLAMYSAANTGPLRSLRRDNVSLVEVMGTMRIRYLFEKGRGQYSYPRSFAIDPGDPVSPDCLNEFIELWTSRIRGCAEVESSRNLFIFACHGGAVRSFLTAQDYGTDTDSSWKLALKTLCKRLGLPALTIGQLRFTGLDLVREATNDDLRAVKAAGGQKAESTIRLHYEGAAAARRRSEALSEVMSTTERWVQTKGRVDPRGAPANVGVHAATPGWDCTDPFDSPITGEASGRLCSAYGMCPACPRSKLNANSPYSLARVLQLNAELDQAFDYLDRARWLAAFEAVCVALRTKWIPSFKDPKVWEAAAELNLPPIGKLE